MKHMPPQYTSVVTRRLGTYDTTAPLRPKRHWLYIPACHVPRVMHSPYVLLRQSSKVMAHFSRNRHPLWPSRNTTHDPRRSTQLECTTCTCKYPNYLPTSSVLHCHAQQERHRDAKRVVQPRPRTQVVTLYAYVSLFFVSIMIWCIWRTCD